MAFSISTVTTWVKDNPLKAAGIGIAAAGAIALAVSPKARKFVGLGRASSSHTTHKVSGRKKAKALRLK